MERVSLSSFKNSVSQESSHVTESDLDVFKEHDYLQRKNNRRTSKTISLENDCGGYIILIIGTFPDLFLSS